MRIGEVARQVGVSAAIIKHYEYKGLLPRPVRDSSGYRAYGDSDLERIKFVTGARQLGFSFADIREVLAVWDAEETPGPRILDLITQKVVEVGERIDRLRSMRRELSDLHELTQANPGRAICRVTSILQPQIECSPQIGRLVWGRARQLMPAVLFVCTGNRARSPIAAACFRKELAARNLEGDWRVSSAGTWATDGLLPTPDAIAAARRMGLDISEHRSSAITLEALDASNLIVVMEQGQKEALATEFPNNANKLHLLSELATGIPYSISDPVMLPNASGIYAEIAELIHKGFERIQALATEKLAAA